MFLPPSVELAFMLLLSGVLTATTDQMTPSFNLTKTGMLQPRNASDNLAGSFFGVGTETMDRNYTVYANWEKYLGPLGVKRARLEGGWMRCEPTAGQYNFGWLDEIVASMAAAGVKPCMTLVFGNPLYAPFSSDPTFYGSAAAPLPNLTNTTVKTAWTAWVTAVSSRYAQYGVNEFEVWNEPDIHLNATDYGIFVAVTTEAVLAGNPNGTTFLQIAYDIQFAHDSLAIAKTVIASPAAFDAIVATTYHPYTANPDHKWAIQYPQQLLASITQLSPHMKVIQGESGAPSVAGGYGALGNYPWDEVSQAKWALRRLLSDWAHHLGGFSSLFSIADMCYQKDGKLDVNHKGLLAINCTTKKVIRPKMGYFALQHLTTLIDNSLSQPRIDWPISGTSRVMSNNTNTATSVIVMWNNEKATDQPPANNTAIANATFVHFNLNGASFNNPVLVDVLSGGVYDIPACANQVTSCAIPIYDSPIVLAERSTVPIGPSSSQPVAATGVV
eukprot:m.44861 g.44861  ORF g.44861 m.44861 type:complete len:500 (-) comp19797_c0_seq1:42-1541(-)